jgi:hypothetical protein
VRIAARGDQDAAAGACGEVGRHERGRSAVERERARRHALAPQGDEVGDARGILRREDAEGITPVDDQVGEASAGVFFRAAVPASSRRAVEAGARLAGFTMPS